MAAAQSGPAVPFVGGMMILGLCAPRAAVVAAHRATMGEFDSLEDSGKTMDPSRATLADPAGPGGIEEASWYIEMNGINCFEPNFEAMSHLDVLSSGLDAAKIDEASSSPTLLATFKATLLMNKIATSHNCKLCDLTIWGKDPGAPGGDGSWARASAKCAAGRMKERPEGAAAACFSSKGGGKMRRINNIAADDCRPCPPECAECHLSMTGRFKAATGQAAPRSFQCVLPKKPASPENPVKDYQCTEAKSQWCLGRECKHDTKCKFPEFSNKLYACPKDYAAFWPEAEKHAQSLEFVSDYKLSNWSAFSAGERARLGELQGEMNDLLMGIWKGPRAAAEPAVDEEPPPSTTAEPAVDEAPPPSTTAEPAVDVDEAPPPLPARDAPLPPARPPPPPPPPTTPTAGAGGKGDLLKELLSGGTQLRAADGSRGGEPGTGDSDSRTFLDELNSLGAGGAQRNLKPVGGAREPPTQEGGPTNFLDELKGLAKDPKSNLKPAKPVGSGDEEGAQSPQEGAMGDLAQALRKRREAIVDEEPEVQKECDAKTCEEMKATDGCEWCPAEDCCEQCCPGE